MSVACPIVFPKLKLSPHKAISPQIHDFLRKQITELTIKPGSILSENALSEHFSVSRQPVREALMRLSYEGLITIMPQRGSVVEKICIGQLNQAIFIRTAIEKACITALSQQPEAKLHKNLNQLEKIIDQQRSCRRDRNLKSNFLRLDDLFHEKLCVLSGHSTAWDIIQGIKGQMDRLRFLSFESAPVDAVANEHAILLQLLKERLLPQCHEHLSQHFNKLLDYRHNIIIHYHPWFTSESLNLLAREEGVEAGELLKSSQPASDAADSPDAGAAPDAPAAATPATDNLISAPEKKSAAESSTAPQPASWRRIPVMTKAPPKHTGHLPDFAAEREELAPWFEAEPLE